MGKVSRRNAMKSSIVAAVALCVPELWPESQSEDSAAKVPAKPASAPARSGAAADFADEIRLSRAYTLECAQAMPEARYNYRPVPQVRSFGQQMVHIGESVRGIYEVFIEGKSFPTTPFSEAGREVVKTKAEIVAGLREAFDYVQKAATRLNDRILEGRVKSITGSEVSKRRMLRFLLDHATHHRGQIVVYLRLNGIRPPFYRA